MRISIEYRWAEDKPSRFPGLPDELVRLNVDVLVIAGGTAAALAAKRATPTIPIVFTAVGDPVQEELVNSLSFFGWRGCGDSGTDGTSLREMSLVPDSCPACLPYSP